ncbi:MAG: phosphoribosyltransferase family protein [Candidatus Paceibacterota bacterium]
MQIINAILDIVFPTKCILCKKVGKDLCLACLHCIPQTERESLKWIFPIYDYRDTNIKKLLWFLKYKGKKRLAKVFAEIIYDKILEELSELSIMENFRKPILIPIPLSRKRYKERGYNQAELICEEIIKLNNLRDSVDVNNIYSNTHFSHGVNMKLENNILIKIKETEHQALIKDRRTRLRNLSGSFAIENQEKNKEKIKNKNIILIDDITTTGATLNEAKKVLKQAGARKVIAFTVAH